MFYAFKRLNINRIDLKTVIINYEKYTYNKYWAFQMTLPQARRKTSCLRVYRAKDKKELLNTQKKEIKHTLWKMAKHKLLYVIWWFTSHKLKFLSDIIISFRMKFYRNFLELYIKNCKNIGITRAIHIIRNVTTINPTKVWINNFKLDSVLVFSQWTFSPSARGRKFSCTNKRY